MAWSYTYDTATPAGATDTPREGDDRIREIKLAVQERMNVDHDWTLNGTEVDDGATGHHRQVVFMAPLADVTLAASEGGVFTKDVSSKAELHYKDEDANALQLTSGGKILLSGEYDQELNLSNTGNTILGDVIACTSAGYLTLPIDSTNTTEGNLRYNSADDTLSYYNGSAAWVPLALVSALEHGCTGVGTGTGGNQTVDCGFAPGLVVAFSDAASDKHIYFWLASDTDANYELGGSANMNRVTGGDRAITVSGDVITFVDGIVNENTDNYVYFAFALTEGSDKDPAA